MATDWIPIRHVPYEEFLQLDLPKVKLDHEIYRIEIPPHIGFIYRTSAGGIIYSEYNTHQSHDNEVRKKLRELLKTDFVSYLGSTNYYDEFGEASYEPLFEREYPDAR
jgi:hypothetical protein